MFRLTHSWLAVAFTAYLLAILPSSVAADQHQNAPEQFIDGTLEIVHIDEADHSRSRLAYYLLSDQGAAPGKSGTAFELRFSRTPPAGLKTGDHLNIRGRAVGRTLWVDDVAATQQQSGTTTQQGALAESSVANPHSAVIILVNIAGTTVWTDNHVNAVNGVMFDDVMSVDGIYAEASFNQMGFPASHGAVVAPVTVNKIATCPVFDYADAADAAALAQRGVDVSAYQHRIYIIPSDSLADSDCTWLAVGVLGSYGSTSTLRAWSTIIDASALAHELGHNAGWHHAATDTNNNGFDLAESSDLEYGDTSDTMGYCCVEKKFNAVHLDQIGWFDNQPAGTVLTVGGGGTYTLVPLGSDPVATPGTQILKVGKPDTNEVYYLSYRQRIGRDANVPTSYTGGLNIHHASETGQWSYFIEALADNASFDDPVNGLTVTQNWHDADGVNITISYDSCLPADPTVSVAPTAQLVDSTTTPSATYDVTIVNNDSAGCTADTFTLSSDLGTLSSGSVAAVAGATPAVVTLTLNTALPDGDTNFVVTAARGPNSAAGGGTLTVDTQPPSIPGAPAAVGKKTKGQQSIEVTWTASSDAASGVAYYTVMRDGVAVSTGGSLKFVDTAADPNVAHTYEIVAVDGLNHASSAAVADYAPSSGGGGGSGKGGGNPNKGGGKNS